MIDLLGGPDLLMRASAYCLASLPTEVTAQTLCRATPCSAWDVRMLLEHIVDSATALTELATGSLPLAQPAAEPISGAELTGRLREHIMALVVAWESAGASETLCEIGDQLMWTGTAAAIGAIEVAVHTWDLAQACGLDRPVPDRLAGDLLDVASRLLSHPFRHPEFAERVEVHGSPSESDLLLAFLGRDARCPVNGDGSAPPRGSSG